MNVEKIAVENHPKMWGAEAWRVLPGHPLLFKVIDARERLSVQVHPNEQTRRVTGGVAFAEGEDAWVPAGATLAGDGEVLVTTV